MKKVLLLIAFAGIFTACKQEENQEAIAETPETATAIPTETAKEGHGKVELKCGSHTLVVEGRSGGDTTSGDMIIAIQDKTVSTKVFTISFNGKDYPQDGKVYHVKKSDFMGESKKPDNEVHCGFTEVSKGSMMDWSSDDASGTLQFTVKGNEINCKFSNMKLQPSAMYNKGEMNSVGTASGEITIYKN
jgi:hypothetical protein